MRLMGWPLSALFLLRLRPRTIGAPTNRGVWQPKTLEPHRLRYGSPTHFTFIRIQSSRSLAMSRLFFSIITM